MAVSSASPASICASSAARAASQRLLRPLRSGRGGVPCEEESLEASEYAWAGWRLLAGDDLSPVTHSQLAVQAFQHICHRPRIAAPLRPGQQLKRSPAVLHRVVPGHPAAVPEAERSVEAHSRSQRAVGSLRVLCRHSEASVEAVKELLQQGVGLLDGDCTSESELGHQPILERSRCALHSTLSPNPPKDTDGRREESGRGVRELQGK